MSDLYYFNLTIGDCSGDGHGKYQWILCKAQQPVSVTLATD